MNVIKRQTDGRTDRRNDVVHHVDDDGGDGDGNGNDDGRRPDKCNGIEPDWTSK